MPLDLYIIDLGGGLKNPEAATATPEEVTSVPFRHVLGGMLNPAVQAKGPRPVNMSGFLSVMGQAMIGGNQHGGERFGDRSYAIVSDRYLKMCIRDRASPRGRPSASRTIRRSPGRGAFGPEARHQIRQGGLFRLTRKISLQPSSVKRRR